MNSAQSAEKKVHFVKAYITKITRSICVCMYDWLRLCRSPSSVKFVRAFSFSTNAEGRIWPMPLVWIFHRIKQTSPGKREKYFHVQWSQWTLRRFRLLYWIRLLFSCITWLQVSPGCRYYLTAGITWLQASPDCRHHLIADIIWLPVSPGWRYHLVSSIT